jgi:hypothetical protein
VSRPTFVTTSGLALAIGWSQDTVARAAARGDLSPVSRTPGTAARAGCWRWTPEAAAELVRAQGREPPADWTEEAPSSGAAA